MRSWPGTRFCVICLGAAGQIAFAFPPVGARTASTATSSCRVTDGDTLRCGSERVRLLGIDAPEMPGHCRRGRHCVPGDPFSSAANLRRVSKGRLTIRRVGKDKYGRTLATVSGASGDLSCLQLGARMAVYRMDWDDDRRVAATCPMIAR